MCICVARCRGVSMVYIDRVGDVTEWEARGTRKSFAWGSSSEVHDALEDWLCLGIGDIENVDVSLDTILIEITFVDSIIIAINDFILRETYLTFDWRRWDRESWIVDWSGWGLLWWRAHVQRIQMLIDNCPCVRIHRLLICLKMIDEVQKNAFEVVFFKAFPYYEHYDIDIDYKTHNYIITLISKFSNDDIDMKDVK